MSANSKEPRHLVTLACGHRQWFPAPFPSVGELLWCQECNTEFKVGQARRQQSGEMTSLGSRAGTCHQNGWCEIADIYPDPRIVDGVTAEPYWSNLAGACIAPDSASASAVQTRTHRGVSAGHRDAPERTHHQGIKWREAPVRSDHRVARSVDSLAGSR
jgi:hypothetical protein